MNINAAIQCIQDSKTWTTPPFLFKWEEGGSAHEVDLSGYIQGRKMTVDDIVSLKQTPPTQTKCKQLAIGWSMGYEFPGKYRFDNFASTLLCDFKLAARNCGFELVVLRNNNFKTHHLKIFGCQKSRIYSPKGEASKIAADDVLKQNISNGKKRRLGERSKSDPRATSTSYANDKYHTCPFCHIRIGYFRDRQRWILKMNDNQSGCNQLLHRFHSFVPPPILAGSKSALQPQALIEEVRKL